MTQTSCFWYRERVNRQELGPTGKLFLVRITQATEINFHSQAIFTDTATTERMKLEM